MLDLLTTILEVVGLVLISAGAWTVGASVGLAVTGCALIALSWSLGR